MWLPFQILKGNVNSFDVVKQEFKFAPTAQYVRFWPENFTSRPCLRIEMFGNPVDTATGSCEKKYPLLEKGLSSLPILIIYSPEQFPDDNLVFLGFLEACLFV